MDVRSLASGAGIRATECDASPLWRWCSRWPSACRLLASGAPPPAVDPLTPILEIQPGGAPQQTGEPQTLEAQVTLPDRTASTAWSSTSR